MIKNLPLWYVFDSFLLFDQETFPAVTYARYSSCARFDSTYAVRWHGGCAVDLQRGPDRDQHQKHHHTDSTPQPFRLVFGCSLQAPHATLNIVIQTSKYPESYPDLLQSRVGRILYPHSQITPPCHICAKSNFYIHHGGRYYLLRCPGCED